LEKSRRCMEKVLSSMGQGPQVESARRV